MGRKISFSDLVKTIKKHQLKVHLPTIHQAYLFAKRAHANQKRLSGEDFITHPLWVAHFVADLKLDESSLVAALLHDVLEDTGVTLEEIEKNFGVEVALLVDGLTDLKVKTKRFPLHQESLPNFRKFLLASVDDVRVLLIRLADKLHNGLTVKYLPRTQQKRFAQRVFHLYAPLCEYVGLGYYQRRLEDIAFALLYPKEFSWLKGKLRYRRSLQEKKVAQLIKEIKEALSQRKLGWVKIYGRAKGLWSTWQKIKRYQKEGKITQADPEVVLDRLGVTILVKDVPACYATLGVIHTHYQYLPEEFDDYISKPKANGYQAIQTTIRWGRETAEIQIKTPQMHEYNEFGPASHIAYKLAQGKSVADFSFSWVKELVSWQNGQKRRRFKVKVFEEYVYVLTPKGDIIQLEKGATPIDFAYKIHTELGNACRRARVNGRLVALDTKLKNGDLVEIIPDRRRRRPSPDWLTFVKMQETKAKIRKALACYTQKNA